MGIRFLCRHCKKRLNVKATQAGKRGKCPHCNLSIDVPLDENQPASREKIKAPPKKQQPAPLQRSTRRPSSTPDSFTLGRPNPPPSFGKVDPIAEAPDRRWYFRSRALGERGPLKSEEMQEYVDSGDVTIGCVVLRDDWEDWVPAESAFPELVELHQSQKQKARLDRAYRESNYPIPDELIHPPQSSGHSKRRFYTFVLVALGILLVSLFVFAMLHWAS